VKLSRMGLGTPVLSRHTCMLAMARPRHGVIPFRLAGAGRDGKATLASFASPRDTLNARIRSGEAPGAVGHATMPETPCSLTTVVSEVISWMLATSKHGDELMMFAVSPHA
jgi:hypothetical protein